MLCSSADSWVFWQLSVYKCGLRPYSKVNRATGVSVPANLPNVTSASLTLCWRPLFLRFVSASLYFPVMYIYFFFLTFPFFYRESCPSLMMGTSDNDPLMNPCLGSVFSIAAAMMAIRLQTNYDKIDVGTKLNKNLSKHSALEPAVPWLKAWQRAN